MGEVRGGGGVKRVRTYIKIPVRGGLGENGGTYYLHFSAREIRLDTGIYERVYININ